MSVHLVDPARRRFASGDSLRPSPEELKEAFVGYFGYFGTYTVEEGAEVVTFHVEGPPTRTTSAQISVGSLPWMGTA